MGPVQEMEQDMNRLIAIAAAAATIGGVAVTSTTPASAQNWDSRHYGDHRRDEYRDQYRDYGRDNHPPRYEYHRNGCSTYTYWDQRRQEYVRKDRCRR